MPFFKVFFIVLFMVTIPFVIFNNQMHGAMFGDTTDLFRDLDTFFTIYMTSIGEYGFTGEIPND